MNDTINTGERMLRQCYQGVAQALHSSEVIPSSWKDWYRNFTDSHDKFEKDPIELLVHNMCEAEPEIYSHATLVHKIRDEINTITESKLPKLPFATRLLTPSSFYESYPEAAHLSQIMSCPIAYAEGNEVLGIGTINPIAGNLLKDLLTQELKAKHKFSPFIFVALVNHRGWSLMMEKHFKT